MEQIIELKQNKLKDYIKKIQQQLKGMITKENIEQQKTVKHQKEMDLKNQEEM